LTNDGDQVVITQNEWQAIPSTAVMSTPVTLWD